MRVRALSFKRARVSLEKRCEIPYAHIAPGADRSEKRIETGQSDNAIITREACMSLLDGDNELRPIMTSFRARAGVITLSPRTYADL